MSTVFNRTATTVGALIVSLMLVGCGTAGAASGASAPPTRGSTTNCRPLAQPTIKADTPTIAILGIEGEALTSYDQDTNLVVQSAKATKSRIIVNGVSDSTDAPNLLSNVVLEGEGNNNLARTNDINCKAAKVNEATDTLKKGHSAQTPNVFDALNALAGNLANNPSTQPVDVVLLTPLVAQGGGVDLSDTNTLDDPVAAINTLAANGLIPSCKDWRIYGVSPSTGLDDVMAARLKDFWIRYVEKCGGNLVAWEDHLATFPATSPIAAADTSQIKVATTPSEVTVTLGDVMFAHDSASLREDQATAMNTLLDLVSVRGGSVTITGYASPDGSAAHNLTLSQQRADAVSAWLIAHGVDRGRIHATGKGEAEPLYPAPQTEAQTAANRRVVVVVHEAG